MCVCLRIFYSSFFSATASARPRKALGDKGSGLARLLDRGEQIISACGTSHHHQFLGHIDAHILDAFCAAEMRMSQGEEVGDWGGGGCWGDL